MLVWCISPTASHKGTERPENTVPEKQISPKLEEVNVSEMKKRSFCNEETKNYREPDGERPTIDP